MCRSCGLPRKCQLGGREAVASSSAHVQMQGDAQVQSGVHGHGSAVGQRVWVGRGQRGRQAFDAGYVSAPLCEFEWPAAGNARYRVPYHGYQQGQLKYQVQAVWLVEDEGGVPPVRAFVCGLGGD